MAHSSSSSSSSLLASILQRAPIVTHLSLIPLALWGPQLAPALYAAVLLITHACLLQVNLRSIWGALKAWDGVLSHASTDWRREWVKGREKRRLQEGVEGVEDVLDFESVEHVILIPNYAEDLSTLSDTLDVLASHSLARTSYRIVLAMEEREQTAVAKARTLMSSYAPLFLDISYTLHPPNLQGESAGKSSNLAWASRTSAMRHAREDPSRLGRMVITVMDSDTCFAADYFASVACKFALATPEQRTRMMFAAPICFDRNAHTVPVSVRVTDILWSLAGLSSIFPGSSTKIPTSAYSVSMMLAMQVGFWDAGPEAIGEDMHMSLKCLFGTRGHLICETIYSPASQLNVVGGERGGIRGFLNDHKARYVQAVRHMWGCLDTGYSYRRLLLGEFGPGAIKLPEEDHLLSRPSLSSQPLSASAMQHPPPSTRSHLHQRHISVPVIDPGTFQLSDLSPAPSTLSTPSVLSTPFSESSSLSEFELGSPSGRVSPPLDSPATSVYSSPSGSPELKPTTMSRESSWLGLGGSAAGPHEVANHPDAPQEAKILITPFLSVFARLYEAHMLMGNMFILLTMLTLFPPATTLASGEIVPAKPLLPFLRGPEVVAGLLATWAIHTARYMGPASFYLTLVMCISYDAYHRATSLTRWTLRLEGSTAQEPSHLGQQPSERSYRPFPTALIDYLFFPAGIVFGIIPLLHVQFLQLFTNKLTYTVSLKPKAPPPATASRSAGAASLV